MTVQVIAAFLAGALVWPVVALALALVEELRGWLAFRRATKRRVMEREELEKRKAAGLIGMTVDEWESYYGPLPTDREMLI